MGEKYWAEDLIRHILNKTILVGTPIFKRCIIVLGITEMQI